MILLNASQLSKLTDQRLGAYRKMVRNRLSFYQNRGGSVTTPTEKRLDQLNAADDLIRKESRKRASAIGGTGEIEFLSDISQGSGKVCHCVLVGQRLQRQDVFMEHIRAKRRKGK